MGPSGFAPGKWQSQAETNGHANGWTCRKHARGRCCARRPGDTKAEDFAPKNSALHVCAAEWGCRKFRVEDFGLPKTSQLEMQTKTRRCSRIMLRNFHRLRRLPDNLVLGAARESGMEQGHSWSDWQWLPVIMVGSKLCTQKFPRGVWLDKMVRKKFWPKTAEDKNFWQGPGIHLTKTISSRF